MIEDTSNDMLRVEQKFLSLINARNSVQVLGSSSSQNLLGYGGEKEIKNYAHKYIDSILSLQSSSNIESSTKEIIELAHKGFICLYYSASSTAELINILKKHQSFIVKLFLLKHFNDSRIHLQVIQQVLNCMVLDLKFKYVESDLLESLLNTVCYTPNVKSDQMVNLITAFHFLSCQCLIKSVSLQLNAVRGNATFYSILEQFPEFFLLHNNFVKWLPQDSSSSREKHLNNIIKILSGFLKICEMASKAGNFDNKLVVTKLTMKLIEFQWMKDRTININLGDIDFSNLESLEVFYNDLKTTVPIESYPELDSAFKGLDNTIPKSEIMLLINDIEKHKEDFSKLRTALLNSCDQSELLNDDAFIAACFRSLKSSSSCLKPLSNLILKFFVTNIKNLKVLSKNHLKVLDFITIQLKDFTSDPESYEFILGAVSPLQTVLSTFDQQKRIKNLANILYGLGLNHPLPANILYRSLVLALSYDLSLYSTIPDTNRANYRQSLVSKVEKCSRTLFKSGKTEGIARTIMEFFDIMHSHVNNSCELGELNMKYLIRCLIDGFKLVVNLPKKLFGEGSKYLDVFKTSLFIELLSLIEGNSSRYELVESLIENLSISDYKSKLICMYHYYTFNGLNNYIGIDFEERDIIDPMCYLLMSGIILHKNINVEWSESNIKDCIYFLERYFSSTKTSNDYEAQIITTFVNYLRYNGLFFYIKGTLEMFQNHRPLGPDPKLTKLNFDLMLEYATACTSLKLDSEVLQSLDASGKMLKSLFSTSDGPNSSLISPRDLMNWKLVQLNYYVSKGDFNMANDKLGAILTFANSKSEFTLSNQNLKQLSMIEKLQNLISVANLNLIAARLNMERVHYFDAHRCTKTGLKLVLSVIKTITNNLSMPQYNGLKWKSCNLLVDFYHCMIDILSFLGISRDLSYYVNELKKLNDSTSFPLLNGFNHFYLAESFLKLQMVEKGLRELKKGNEIVLINIDKCLDFTSTSSNILFYSVNNDQEGFEELLYKQHKLMNEDDDLKYSHGRSDYEKLIIQNHYNAGVFKKIPPEIADYSNPLYTFLEIKARFTESLDKLCKIPSYSDFTNSVIVTPCVVGSKTNTISEIVTCVLELNELKHMTGKLLMNNISILPIHILKDISSQFVSLGLTLSSLKREDSDLRLEMYYAQDLVKSLSLRNDRKIRDQTTSSANDSIIPSGISDQPKVSYSIDSFTDVIKNLLPDSWTIMTIDICSETGDLLISKLNKQSGYEPIFARLPLNRMSNLEKGNLVFDFNTAVEKLNDIINKSNESIKPAVTSSIKSKEDRKNWWRLRFSLDLEMKELLDDMEHKWLGAFSALFSDDRSHNTQEDRFESYINDFGNMLDQLLPTGFGELNIETVVIKMLLKIAILDELSSFEDITKHREVMDDLIYFLIDSLMYRGQENAYDEINLDKFYDNLTSICSNFKAVEQSDLSDKSAGHLIIIPGSECTVIPWETFNCMKGRSVSRMPSVHLALEMLKQRKSLKVNESSNLESMYLINPGGDLLKTEERFSSLFNNMTNWEGLIGRAPDNAEQFLLDMLKKDMFIYIGHGGCEQYIRVTSLFKLTDKDHNLPPALLFGCSSGALQTNGIFEANGNLYNWLTCGSPMIVANLWDVTDKDIDKFSLSVFESTSLFENSDLQIDFSEAVRTGRQTCNLKYLNGSAPVVYGLPLHL